MNVYFPYRTSARIINRQSGTSSARHVGGRACTVRGRRQNNVVQLNEKQLCVQTAIELKTVDLKKKKIISRRPPTNRVVLTHFMERYAGPVSRSFQLDQILREIRVDRF